MTTTARDEYTQKHFPEDVEFAPDPEKLLWQRKES